MQRLLIIGSGDVARRALPKLIQRYRVYALVRDPEQAGWWRARGVTPIAGDLDQPRSLRRLAGLAQVVVHLAPPGDTGDRDYRTRHLLAALANPSALSLPQRFIYISTSGVYGDCQGARVTETRPCRPATARAKRRVDAEQCLRQFARRHGITLCILRAPGIYGDGRLPLARIRAATPALVAEEDVRTNHIHADDLALTTVLAITRGRANRVYHVSDDSGLPMGAYFDLVADHFALPRPPRLPRQILEERLSPVQRSFMAESRALDNGRLKRELLVTLRYPTVAAGLAALKEF